MHTGLFPVAAYGGGVKLEQGQVWKRDEQYLRIVKLERLKVGYKLMPDLASQQGHHREVTKKEFCRLIKTATLLTAVQVLEASAK